MLHFAYLYFLFLSSANADYVYIAGYEPETDVYNHSRIDLDQAEIVAHVKNYDFDAAKAVYENGGNSVKGTGAIRTLKGFSVNSCKQQSEKYFDISNAYWTGKGLTECNFADDIMEAAFDGTEVAGTGFSFAASDSTGSDDFRNQAIKKGVLNLNVFLYTIWEMQDAINDCLGGDLSTNTDAVHAWDEAVAFYTGSAEGIQRGGVNGLESGEAHVMFTLAEKRCKNFGTCTADYDANPIAGYSAINDAIFADFERMKAYLTPESSSTTFNCQNAYTGKDRIVSKMLVPMIQGALRYLYETDSRIEPNGATNKELGEFWAFVTGILPMIHFVNPSVAEDLYKYTWGQDRSNDNFASMKTKLESTYEDLGITCEDVGTLCDKAITTSCTAYTESELSYDTTGCTSSTPTPVTIETTKEEDEDTIIIIIIVVCALLLLIVVGLIYYAYTQRHKYQSLVEQQQLANNL